PALHGAIAIVSVGTGGLLKVLTLPDCRECTYCPEATCLETTGQASCPGRFSVSETLDAPHCGALKSMFWRSEILQVMFWLRGEGFGEEVDASVVERFLGVDAQVGIQYLDQLVEEGLIDRIGDLYTLSELGRREAGLEFAQAF